MARPKRIQGKKTARERMEDAFWDMLAEMPYHEMTGKGLRGRAGVSHNTFYYYYDDLDDMARKLFQQIDIAQGPLAVLSLLQRGGAPANVVQEIPDFPERYRHVRLLAGSGSPMILDMLHDSVRAAWLDAVGLEESDLTPEDRIDLEFAFGGAIALLGSGDIDDFMALAGFPLALVATKRPRRATSAAMLGGMSEVTTSANVRLTEPPNDDENPARLESATLSTKNATNASATASTEVVSLSIPSAISKSQW